MNLHDTLPLDAATQGVCSTLKEPASAGMLVVVVDVVAVEDVVVVATVLVVVVAIEDVVTGVGDVSPPPQPAPAMTIAAISAARPCACHANPWVPDGAIICPPFERCVL